MGPNFKAEEFLMLSPIERIKWCRAMAQEAESLAAGASGELRTAYADLAKQWTLLAQEISRTRD
jgi:hypothetical protein